MVFSVKYILCIGFSNENMGFLGCFKLYCRWVYQCILSIKQLLSSFQQKAFAKNITDKAILRSVIKNAVLFWVTVKHPVSLKTVHSCCLWMVILTSPFHLHGYPEMPKMSPPYIISVITELPALSSPHIPCRHAICFSLYWTKSNDYFIYSNFMHTWNCC